MILILAELIYVMGKNKDVCKKCFAHPKSGIQGIESLKKFYDLRHSMLIKGYVTLTDVMNPNKIPWQMFQLESNFNNYIRIM